MYNEFHGAGMFPFKQMHVTPTQHRKATVATSAAIAILACFLCFAKYGDPQQTQRSVAPLEWGLYQILWSRDFCDRLEREVGTFASKPKYVMFFRDLGRPYPKGPNDCIAKSGATPIVSMELWSWHAGGDGSYLPAIAAGRYDKFLRQWARDAKADGRRVLLRFGFEFNGNWFSWCRKPGAFKKAWRHAHDIFKEVGADNVEWLWTPNVVSCPDSPENAFHLYYPGDEYVSWVGVDGYNFGEHHDEWHGWQSFDDVFAVMLEDLHARFPRKPIMIAEFGCASGRTGQREEWIRAALESLRQRPYIKAAIWFNYDKRREGEPNWRIDATPDSLRVFNETFAAPRPSN